MQPSSWKFALLGSGISKSLSPRLFALAYSGKWPYELVDTCDFDAAWESFIANYHAVNVTAPFKELAYRRAALPSKECIDIGAANILVKTERGVEAYNSDYLGVRAMLQERGFSGGSAVVAGFGGAGKAAARAALDLGMQVSVCNRSPRACDFAFYPLSELPGLCRQADLLIYTIPEAVAELNLVRIENILEANYSSPVLKGCAGNYISGKEWNLKQAQFGYSLMCGEMPNVEKMLASIL